MGYFELSSQCFLRHEGCGRLEVVVIVVLETEILWQACIIGGEANLFRVIILLLLFGCRLIFVIFKFIGERHLGGLIFPLSISRQIFELLVLIRVFARVEIFIVNI
jgi:hypothetical protein